MVSMKDIARDCGVSIATVSKALNDYSDIGEATREKVRRTADELGYFPNSSARALKTKRTFNLGVLLADEAGMGLTHDYFASVLQSFKVCAEEKGYDINFTSSNISSRKTSYLEHCRYRGVDGVLIACINFYDPSVQELVLSDLPVVTIDHVFDNRIAVVSDNVQGIKELVELVLEKGHRRIAYIHGADSSVTRSRLNSFYHTLAQHDISVPEEYIGLAAYRDVEAARKETRRLLRLSVPPTCIFYPDDISTLGGINAIQGAGLTVGRDISICGYDGIFLANLLQPPLTTVRQNTDEIGRIAARKLISLIENPKSTMIERIVVKGTLVPGASVADIRDML